MIAENSAARRGVIYIEDFDDPSDHHAPHADVMADVLAPSFSAEDMETARRQAYADGCRDGGKAAAREREHAVHQLLERLEKSIAATTSELLHHAEEIAEELARTLLASLCGSLPDLCRTHADREMRALIRRIMPGLAREPRLEIRVHPDLVAPVQDEIAHLPQNLPEQFAIVGDNAMEPTDLRAFWKNGHLVRSSTEIWREIHEELVNLAIFKTPTPDSGSNHAA